MSTPINPYQPQGDSGSTPREPAPTPAAAPFGLPPENRGAVPQGTVPAVPGQPHPLDTGAPTQARLPQPLGEDGRSTPIGFGRLLTVELRKMLDTRAGKWLIGVTVALIIVASALVAYNERDHVSFFDLIGAALIPMNYLVPILGIMAVTAEWSQRTGLVTFTLEPRRSRVALAKLAATLILAALATVIALASAALFTAVMGSLGSGEPNWHLNGLTYATLFLYLLIEGGMGVAFGLLLQNTPGAICAFLFIPILISFLNIVSWGRTLAEWINPGQALGQLVNGSLSGHEWAQVAVCSGVWLVVPMVLGFIRLNRREVKSS